MRSAVLLCRTAWGAGFELLARAPGQPEVIRAVRVQEHVAPGERVTFPLKRQPGHGHGLAVMAVAGVTPGAQSALVATVAARGRS